MFQYVNNKTVNFLWVLCNYFPPYFFSSLYKLTVPMLQNSGEFNYLSFLLDSYYSNLRILLSHRVSLGFW